MSTDKKVKEIKLSQDVLDASEVLTEGFSGFDETGTGSFSDDSLTEVTGKFYTPEEEKRVQKGRDVLIAATAHVFANQAPTFLSQNEKVKEVTVSTSLGKDTIGHSMNREYSMVSEYTARGANGSELKKVYKLLATKMAEE